MRAIYTLVLFFALLAGCSTTPPLAHYPKTQAVLDQWSLSAKFGVKTSQDGGTFTVVWHQHLDGYIIDIHGPLAQGRGRLVKNERGVTYYASSGETATAADADQLLRREMGLALPVSALQYWLQGKASPWLDTATIVRDQNHFPRTIQQENWTIAYDRFKPVADLVLPFSLKISNPVEQVEAKIIVRQWQPLK